MHRSLLRVPACLAQQPLTPSRAACCFTDTEAGLRATRVSRSFRCLGLVLPSTARQSVGFRLASGLDSSDCVTGFRVQCSWGIDSGNVWTHQAQVWRFREVFSVCFFPDTFGFRANFLLTLSCREECHFNTFDCLTSTRTARL